MNGTTLLVFIVLLAFPLALRIRRELNFQRVGSARIKARMVLMSLVAVMVTVVLAGLSLYLAVLAWAISLSLVSLSLRLTVLQRRADGVWFRANPWVGGTLVLLFVGRLGYRVFQILGAGGLETVGGEDPMLQIGRSPLSLMVLLLLLSYHAVYYGMVTRRAAHIPDDMTAAVETTD